MKLSDLQTHSQIVAQDHDPEYRAERDRTAFAREIAVAAVAYRAERGMSQRDLAAATGLAQPAVGAARNRRPNPAAEQAMNRSTAALATAALATAALATAALATAALATAALLAITASPSAAAAAPPAGTVYIQERVGHRWDTALRAAARTIDTHTRTRLRWVHTCPASADRCIRVALREMPHHHGLTVHYQPDGDSARVYLTRAYARRNPWPARRTLALHELGHAMGLAHGPRNTAMHAAGPELGSTTQRFSPAHLAFLSHR